MTEAKFTKGPWKPFIRKNHLDELDGFSIINETSSDRLTCDFNRFGRWQYVLGNDEEQIANAHLIAAAPEMYELLDEVSHVLGHNLNPTHKAYIKSIGELLAKARGES